MTLALADFLTVDLPALAAAALACLSCSLAGTFLVLRRQAMMGDAISHVVLPGIVGAFAVAGGIEPLATMLGALLAALVAAAAIEVLRTRGGVESGAAMGTVFTVMFALGVCMLEWTGASEVHLDTRHALFGSLEAILWVGHGGSWAGAVEPAALAALPRQVTTLAVVAAALAVLCALFFKELRVATFDPGFAATAGFSPRLVGIGLVLASGAAAVASFEAVGSILAVAMFVCPPCAARMLTDRLSAQLWLAALFAAASGILGYLAAAFGPWLFGSPHALNAAGAIAVTAGLIQLTAMLFAPRHGVLAQRRRAAYRGGR